MNRVFLFAMILVFSLLSLVLKAGNDGVKMIVKQGRVVDGKTFQGIAGAEVQIQGTNIKVYTDFDGNFELPALPSGSYSISGTSISYKDVNLRGLKFEDENGQIELRMHSK